MNIRSSMMRGLLCGIVALFISGAAFAQAPNAESPPAAPAPAPAAAPVPDPLGRDTPAGMVAGFLAAAGEQNYERAAQYFDLSGDRAVWGPGAARQLQLVLDRGGSVYSRLRLSDQPAGNQNDGLMPNQEKFGSVRTDRGEVDLLAERVNSDSGQIWLISQKTVAELPLLLHSVDFSFLDRTLPESLRNSHFLGAPSGHWLAVLVLAVVAYALAWLVTYLATLVLLRTFSGSDVSRLQRLLRASALPIRLLLTCWIAWAFASAIGVSIVARQQVARGAEVLAWIAIAWILWRAVDAVAEYAIDRMTLRGRLSMFSAVTFIRRSAKAAIVAIATIAALDAFGFNVTAGLAALGIGGIAIALGAQKTIEHFVGSLTLVADQPVRVGDFCRFGDTLGTVEDIGMRSTRIRTLDRTVVSIPNGLFAATQIENFSRRDKFWFHPFIDLRYQTTAAQTREVLKGIREILLAHPDVLDDPARVRLVRFAEKSLRIEVFAYVAARDNDRFLEIQEELMLGIIEIVEKAGAGFANT